MRRMFGVPESSTCEASAKCDWGKSRRGSAQSKRTIQRVEAKKQPPAYLVIIVGKLVLKEKTAEGGRGSPGGGGPPGNKRVTLSSSSLKKL